MKKKTTSRSSGQRYAIVVSEFNEFITERLLSACQQELKSLGVGARRIAVSRVPGAFELPVAAWHWARRPSVAAVICLGAVIRGETFHFELVARAAAEGISAVALQTGKPVIFGVITADTVQQAYDRSDEKGDNKGREAARAAVAMVKTLRCIR